MVKRIAMGLALLAPLLHAQGAAAHTHHSTRHRVNRLEHEMAQLIRQERADQAQIAQDRVQIHQLRDTLSCFQAMDVHIPDEVGSFTAAYASPDAPGFTFYLAILDQRTLDGRPCMTPDPALSNPAITGYFHGMVLPF